MKAIISESITAALIFRLCVVDVGWLIFDCLLCCSFGGGMNPKWSLMGEHEEYVVGAMEHQQSGTNTMRVGMMEGNRCELCFSWAFAPFSSRSISQTTTTTKAHKSPHTMKGSTRTSNKLDSAAYTAGIQLCFQSIIVVACIPPCAFISATRISPFFVGFKTPEADLKNS